MKTRAQALLVDHSSIEVEEHDCADYQSPPWSIWSFDHSSDRKKVRASCRVWLAKARRLI